MNSSKTIHLKFCFLQLPRNKPNQNNQKKKKTLKLLLAEMLSFLKIPYYCDPLAAKKKNKTISFPVTKTLHYGNLESILTHPSRKAIWKPEIK